MPLRSVAFWSVVGPLLASAGAVPAGHRAPVRVQLTLATIHAAALTTPRTAKDSADEPYLLVSMLGPGPATSAARLPASAHLTIHRDEALGTRPLITLSLQPGDSIRLLLSLLEAPQVRLTDETRAATAAAAVLSREPAARAADLPAALAPLTRNGAHFLGSVAALLTNEGGTLHWRSFECVASCRVLVAPAAATPMDPAATPLAGVVELSGDGGTYHFRLEGQRLR